MQQAWKKPSLSSENLQPPSCKRSSMRANSSWSRARKVLWAACVCQRFGFPWLHWKGKKNGGVLGQLLDSLQNRLEDNRTAQTHLQKQLLAAKQTVYSLQAKQAAMVKEHEGIEQQIKEMQAKLMHDIVPQSVFILLYKHDREGQNEEKNGNYFETLCSKENAGCFDLQTAKKGQRSHFMAHLAMVPSLRLQKSALQH
eukprot:3107531-Amphidinium_carterae.1